MTYRPQFAFQTPRGYRDETFHYSFDGLNSGNLVAVIPTVRERDNIIFQTEKDAEFVIYAIKVALVTAGSTLNVRVYDPFGNQLSQVTIPLTLIFTGAGAAIVGRLVVALADEIIIPSSGRIVVDLYNPTTGNVTPPAFTLFGVKRYPLCEVAA